MQGAIQVLGFTFTFTFIYVLTYLCCLWAQLLLGWVLGNCLQAGNPSWYVTSNAGYLSVAITPRRGTMSASKNW